MDEQRELRVAYLYLCHLEETRLWLSSCIGEELPSATGLEESLRNGVYLARLSHFLAPDVVPLCKIYDADQRVYRERGLCFRHTENINLWLNAMRSIGFPEYFFPDPFDLYEKKNLPKVIYCLHALSLYLFKLGKASRMKELRGKLHFSDDEVEQVQRMLLTNSSAPMPAFDLIDGSLAKATSADSSAVVAINSAIDKGESALLFDALSTPPAHLRGVRPENRDRYCEVLGLARAAKLEHGVKHLSSTGGGEEAASADMYGRLLSLAEVQGYVLEANADVLLGEIDAAMERGDREFISELLLTRSDLALRDLVPENVPAYYEVLFKIREDGKQTIKGFTLTRSDLQMAVQMANVKVGEEAPFEACIDAVNVSLDCGRAEDTLEAFWEPSTNLPTVCPLAEPLYHDQLPFGRRKACRDLSQDELVAGGRILNAIDEVNFALKASGTFDVVACLENPHTHIANVRLQNHGRYVSRLRDALAEKSHASAEEALLTRTEIQRVVNEVNSEGDGQPGQGKAIDRINKAVALYPFSCGHEDAVTIVPYQCRTTAVIRDYRLLIDGAPSVPVLHQFLHMLDIGEHDQSEEMELQRVKGKVVATIRRNQDLQKEVLDMDIRIGLLVRNCITLQEVKGHGGRRESALAAVKSNWLQGTSGGLTALSRRSRERLEAYQHLFYLLQVHPHYLGKLIAILPVHATNNLVESMVYSVYNYGWTRRDEYLLLRLFQFALQEQVGSKLSQPSDILCGNPLVIRMAIGFFRSRGGRNCLEQLLSPLVRDVLEDGELYIDLNPVDIYKKWVNERETTSGKPGGLSYDVAEEQAMQHTAVCKTLHTSVLYLETKALMFARRISASKDMIPYGMRYTCKALKKALEDKFPESPPEDISKVIGNILYYRYIHPAIVAPDTFGVVRMTPEHRVTYLQRRNLGSVAKVLACATSAVPYNQPLHPCLMRLDSLIDSCGTMLHRFFADACAVPEPEDWFGVDSYSEATHITPPTITLTAMELRLTHQYLLEYKDEIAPDPKDPLRGLLADLGPEPTVEDLVGDSGASADGSRDAAVLSSAKISLSLYGKFSELEEESPETDQVLRDTKRMLVELLRVFPRVTTIPELLGEEITPDQERDFLESQSCIRSHRKYGSLVDFREALQKNLNMLEDCGLASAGDDYQDVINGIAGDILKQRNHRLNRKKELAHLVATQRKLDVKTRYYEETLDYYERYLQACLASLASSGKSRRQSCPAGQPQSGSGDVTHPRPLKSRKAIKYSGARLRKKGILLEVSGIETQHLKKVCFEIAPAEGAGMFSVRTKFLGVGTDEVTTIDIQDLLQRQYEGVAVTELAGRARLNNNLLLFFLNKKFCGK
ncbi:ras GTPase-activating-like protein IQGAP1 [Haemaphysalis longicornis]